MAKQPTKAELIAENEQLRAEIARLRSRRVRPVTQVVAARTDESVMTVTCTHFGCENKVTATRGELKAMGNPVCDQHAVVNA